MLCVLLRLWCVWNHWRACSSGDCWAPPLELLIQKVWSGTWYFYQVSKRCTCFGAHSLRITALKPWYPWPYSRINKRALQNVCMQSPLPPDWLNWWSVVELGTCMIWKDRQVILVCSVARESLEDLIGQVDLFQSVHELTALDHVLVRGLWTAVIRRG